MKDDRDLDYTIRLHNCMQLDTAPSPSEAQSQSADKADGGDTKDGDASSVGSRISVPELAATLKHLLTRYVDLLESPQHGGWSLEDDTTVQRARSVLARTGWIVRRR